MAGDDLERWIADARAAEAVDARVRERWLRTQAAESSTIAGTLIALAEAGRPVVVITTAGRRHAGVVTMVGQDFVTVVREERLTLVSLRALASVEHSREFGAAPTDGELEPSLAAPVTLHDVLSRAVGDRPRLMLHAGDAHTTGQLVAVGVDVVTLRTDAEPPGLAYVSLGSVSEASLLDSG